ncbi:hypothetical protein GGH12_004334 [Coemansia sp. RSA 1822]|nr:hypothetical protein LPJ76_004295 [Coemansia sp. RSA 638]KAJ2122194.1 hypothetical protein IW147_003606 [Coemansia sp. RSA 720]KAJ2540848.1 hypothetical protein GGF49_004155 [Coemansia sp. RSA 1853]KAJ2561044.1 hypothetical protein GGH12_004334 [Coemansia sp. RSA 1822]
MNTPVTPVKVVSVSTSAQSERPRLDHEALFRYASQSKPSASEESSREPVGELDAAYEQNVQAPHVGYPKTLHRQESTVTANCDTDSSGCGPSYGRRAYPEFDPSIMGACAVRFIRQFEHAAQHNGLHAKMWAKRLDACLHGRAEDWAFDECPLELPNSMWEARKRQFLDWALLPAEQEIRRQRLLRFYHSESDMSIDFAYTFEEAARGLRDYKEDVWVRKCIANLQPSIRSALFELWPDGLPVRFRDLRDSLYAVDWSLYETASASLKVVKCGAPFVYDSCSQAERSPASRTSTCSSGDRAQTSGRPSLALSTANIQSGSCSPPAPSPALLPTRRRRTGVGTMPPMQSRSMVTSPVATASHSPAGSAGTTSKSSSETTRGTSSSGLYELITTLTRIPERDRGLIMSALEKFAGGEEDSQAAESPVPAAVSPRLIKSQSRLANVSSLASRPATSAMGVKSRASAAAAMAATAHQFASMDTTTRPLLNSVRVTEPTDILDERRASTHRVSSNNSRTSALESDAADGPRMRNSVRVSADSIDQDGKIKLRTRPMTAVPYSRRLSSPLLDIHEDSCDNAIQLDVTAGTKASSLSKDSIGAKQSTEARKTHVRKLSSRKSDSALTTATRSMHASNAGFGSSRDDSVHALRSPEFTVLHPELSQQQHPHRRRERFANALLRLLR